MKWVLILIVSKAFISCCFKGLSCFILFIEWYFILGLFKLRTFIGLKNVIFRRFIFFVTNIKSLPICGWRRFIPFKRNFFFALSFNFFLFSFWCNYLFSFSWIYIFALIFHNWLGAWVLRMHTLVFEKYFENILLCFVIISIE